MAKEPQPLKPISWNGLQDRPQSRLAGHRRGRQRATTMEKGGIQGASRKADGDTAMTRRRRGRPVRPQALAASRGASGRKGAGPQNSEVIVSAAAALYLLCAAMTATSGYSAFPSRRTRRLLPSALHASGLRPLSFATFGPTTRRHSHSWRLPRFTACEQRSRSPAAIRDGRPGPCSHNGEPVELVSRSRIDCVPCIGDIDVI
jgi:hypothetical protein